MLHLSPSPSPKHRHGGKQRPAKARQPSWPRNALFHASSFASARRPFPRTHHSARVPRHPSPRQPPPHTSRDGRCPSILVFTHNPSPPPSNTQASLPPSPTHLHYLNAATAPGSVTTLARPRPACKRPIQARLPARLCLWCLCCSGGLGLVAAAQALGTRLASSSFSSSSC